MPARFLQERWSGTPPLPLRDSESRAHRTRSVRKPSFSWSPTIPRGISPTQWLAKCWPAGCTCHHRPASRSTARRAERRISASVARNARASRTRLRLPVYLPITLSSQAENQAQRVFDPAHVVGAQGSDGLVAQEPFVRDGTNLVDEQIRRFISCLARQAA